MPGWKDLAAASTLSPPSAEQIFFTERYDDVLAANPALFAADRKAMLAAASVYWRERLSPEERAEYRRRAVEEKAAAAEAVAEARGGTGRGLCSTGCRGGRLGEAGDDKGGSNMGRRRPRHSSPPSQHGTALPPAAEPAGLGHR